MAAPACTLDAHCGCGRTPVLMAKARVKCGYAVACATMTSPDDEPGSTLRYKSAVTTQQCTIVDNTVDPVQFIPCERVISFNDSVNTDGWVTEDCSGEGLAPQCGEDETHIEGCEADNPDMNECGGIFPAVGRKCYTIDSEEVVYADSIDIADQGALASGAGSWLEEADFTVESWENISGFGAFDGQLSVAATWQIKRVGPRVPWQIKYRLTDTDANGTLTEIEIVISGTAGESILEITDLASAPVNGGRTITILEVHFGRSIW